MPSLTDDLFSGLGQAVEGHFGDVPLNGDVGPLTIPVTGASMTFETYADFVSRVNPAFRWYRHNVELAKVAQLIADGHLKRVMIWVPPGTGKSETVSRLLGAYYLYRYPNREVGLVSYGADLAEDLAGDAREFFAAAGGTIDNSTKAKGDWATTAGGGMWGKGFAGAIRGRRFHLGIIDDPHKGPESLESAALCHKFQNWYKRTWLNRQNLFFAEGATIVIVMQRIAENDLCGWLLEQPDADQWTIIALDAVRSAEPWQKVDDKGVEIGVIPSSCVVWPDWRAVGDLLLPEALGVKELAEQKTGNEDAFEAQFQQRPRKVAGAILQPEWFERCLPSQVPMLFRSAMGVDLAVSTKDAADYTAAFPVGYGVNGRYYVFRPVHGRMETPDARVAVASRAKAARVTVIAVEAVAFQLSFVQDLKRMRDLGGISVKPVDADKDKEARARGWSWLAKDGLIILVDDGTGWVDAFLDEAKHFPRRKKDQIDALGIAMEALRALGGEIGGAMVGGGERIKGTQIAGMAGAMAGIHRAG